MTRTTFDNIALTLNLTANFLGGFSYPTLFLNAINAGYNHLN